VRGRESRGGVRERQIRKGIKRIRLSKEVRTEGMEGGRKRGREGGKEGWREGGKEGGRERQGERERERGRLGLLLDLGICSEPIQYMSS